ncbi:hypothetical protein RQP46_010141 [Phenoliferia psychrophenolica]
MPAEVKRTLRVACVQLSPVFKDVSASIVRADQLLATSSISKDEIDLLVLPEMAFSGYCFASRDDVLEFTEDPRMPHQSPTFAWASVTARRLNCYVAVGFPQRVPAGPPSHGATPPHDAFFNSQMIVSPSGTLHSIYQKHFLYTTDESWAEPGPDFTTITLSFPSSNSVHALAASPTPDPPTFTIAPCICMDLNPEKFLAPFEAYEFATFVQNARPRVDVVVGSMAWLAAEPPEEGISAEENEVNKWEDVSETVNYWATRLRPLLGSRTAVVVCNRIGTEGESTFTGSSCVITLEDVRVRAYASKRSEEVLRTAVDL